MPYSDSVRFRLYRPDDFAPLYTIEELCFRPPLRFPRDYMRQLTESLHSATWIAEDADRMAGFAIVDWSRERGETLAYIETIEVAPEFRRRGVAMELLRCVESSATLAGAAQIWLHVDENNDAAIQLYRAQGYQRQGSRAHYYARNRAAEVYNKCLKDKP